jgi:hypothetical protein
MSEPHKLLSLPHSQSDQPEVYLERPEVYLERRPSLQLQQLAFSPLNFSSSLITPKLPKRNNCMFPSVRSCFLPQSQSPTSTKGSSGVAFFAALTALSSLNFSSSLLNSTNSSLSITTNLQKGKASQVALSSLISISST